MGRNQKKQSMGQESGNCEYTREMLVKSMGAGRFGKELYFYQETDSTNLRAIQAAKEGAGHGALFVAEKQTAGRGRRGREWCSPAGCNIYFTLLLKPEFPPDKASMLTLVMAYAVQRAVGKYISCGIKWPNDIVVNGRKVCGILTEMSVARGTIEYVVIGVGVNVGKQEFAPELADKATSLEQECGYPPVYTDLLVDIVKEFEATYQQFLQTFDLSAIKEAYNECLVNRNREVRVLEPQGEYSGVARGITDGGELLVELADGDLKKVYAGEVSVRGIYGYV